MSPAADPCTVLIPERGRPDLLGETLDALALARAGLDTVIQVRVLVNGAPRELYIPLLDRHPDITWTFVPRALGFHGAIERLLREVDTPWVYLLNSDMRLHPDALREILPWRDNDVFAIASRITMADPARRREETGYTGAVRGPDGQIELHHLQPIDDTVRAHLFAGGGATLFNAEALRRFMPLAAAYAPFYFEDADWGIQAWAEGMRVLFCPRSHAVHEHRATIARYYSAASIERIIQRNRAYFRWRYGDLLGGPRWHGGRLDRLGALVNAFDAGHWRARRRALAGGAVQRLADLRLSRYPAPLRHGPAVPRVLLISPFAVLPCAHGGARRIAELARACADAIDWLLLHDEASVEPQRATPDDCGFREIHAVGGRPPAGDDLESRWAAHAHSAMLDTARRLIATRRPDIVAFEHVESVGLIEQLDCRVPVVWTLHDAGRSLLPAAQALVRSALSRTAALILTTPQDISYWPHPRPVLVENGVRLPATVTTVPSTGELLLLVAPLRYQPNLEGLVAFLRDAWPLLLARHPSLRLRVLGGESAGRYWGRVPMPLGVELVEGFVDPAPHYAKAVLAINPQQEVEGSALKIAEALAHGRVMISTAAGARGYEDFTRDALIRVPNIAAMPESIESMLRDVRRRQAAEADARAAIEPWSWSIRAKPLIELLRGLVRPTA